MATKCIAITKKGSQCSNKANNGEFCGIHKNMNDRMDITRCEYVDTKMNKCFKKCTNGSFCFLHSEENQCAICYEPMENCRKFINCNHYLCVNCFYESIVNKPNCPLCRTKVQNFEYSDSVNYMVKNKLYSYSISHTYHSVNLNTTELMLFSVFFSLKFGSKRIFDTDGMGEVLNHLKGDVDIYRLFGKMVISTNRSLVKNINKDDSERYEYRFMLI